MNVSTGIEHKEVYTGSLIFETLAEKSSLPIDQMNFLIVQVFALALANVFRVSFHPSNSSAVSRHWIALSAGACMSYFCFGKQVILLFVFILINYFILILIPISLCHHFTLCASIAYLSIIHGQKLWHIGLRPTVDISAPLMIMVQKATSLACSLHDGTAEEKNLTHLQKKSVIKRIPSVLEYFSYLLCFQSIMVGPFFMYADYERFIEGAQYCGYKTTNGNCVSENNNLELSQIKGKNRGIKEPSPVAASLHKFLISIVSAVIALCLLPTFPITYLLDPKFLNSTFVYKMTYILITTTLARQMYYCAWFISDAVCCLSGLSFNGYDECGNAKWDFVSNVNMWKVEFGNSLKSTLDAWNVGTMRWLRLVVYERVPKHATLATYGLSAIWHGFFPGYYLTFVGGAVCTIAARTVRRYIRPKVLKFGVNFKRSYDVITFLATRICLAYLTFPFVLLYFWPSFYVYRSLKFFLHSLALFTIIALPLKFGRNVTTANYINKKQDNAKSH